jgi:hypothetical protein
MRTCLFTVGLSLAATVLCVGSSFAQVDGGPPGVYQVSDLAADVPTGQPLGTAPQYAAPQCGDSPYAGTQCAGPECASQQCGAAPSCGWLDPNGGYCSGWTFRADGVFIQRSTTRSQALFRSGSGNSSPELLNSKTGLNFPVEVGLQVSAIRHGLCDWDIEVGYFQIDGFNANAFQPGASYMMTDVNGTNSFIVTDASARYISALYLGEINVRRECLFDGLTLLAGFRMGELDERYQAGGTAFFFRNPVTFTSSTVNHLYGFQLGADLKAFDNGGPLRVNGLCKAGVYANSINRTSQAVETGVSDRTISATRDQAAFMGEVGIVVSYQFTERLAARFVYQAAWLEGVALAPEQIPNNIDFVAGTGTVDGHGGLFYHGGGVGFELKF